MTSRQKHILNLVVKNYLENGTAASSFNLKKTYRLPFSSPTIRNELKVLEEMRLLEKPFFSAGRLPTVAALEYYLKNFVYSQWPFFQYTREAIIFKKKVDFLIRQFKDIQKLLKNISEMISVTTIAFNEEQYELSGLRYIPIMLSQESNEENLSKNLTNFLECLENADLIRQRLKNLFEHELPYIALDRNSIFSNNFVCTITLSKMNIGRTNFNLVFVGSRRINYKRVYMLAKIINKAKI